MNTFMTLSMLVNTSGKATNMATRHPVKHARELSAVTMRIAEEKAADAEAWRFQRVQRDWWVLASEWLALMGALEQFEREFKQLEENLMCRWRHCAGGNGIGARSTRPAIPTLTESPAHANTTQTNKHDAS
jgi:hypothetical protein